MPETQCSLHSVQGPEGSGGAPGLGAADGHRTSKTSGFTQGVGWPQSVWGLASSGGQAKGSECQVASPGNCRVGGTPIPNRRPPAPRETHLVALFSLLWDDRGFPAPGGRGTRHSGWGLGALGGPGSLSPPSLPACLRACLSLWPVPLVGLAIRGRRAARAASTAWLLPSPRGPVRTRRPERRGPSLGP